MNPQDRPDLDKAIDILQSGGFNITGGRYAPKSNPQDKQTALEKSLKELYEIDADVPEQLGQAFAMLRQLINEEFVHTGTQITTQNIYDVLYPKIDLYTQSREREARIDELNRIGGLLLLNQEKRQAELKKGE